MICLSRWCFMVLYGAVCLNCRFSLKKRSLSKLTYKAKQAEKAVKGLQTMIRKLEREMLAGRTRLKEIDEALASGKITLDKYEAQKTDIQKLIAEYQSKLDDKAGKLQVKEQELEQLTKDAAKVRSVVQPFRKSVLLSSRSATTRSILPHRKLQRKCPCSVQINGLSVKINLSPSSLPRLFTR